jgi:hypothetical protein
MESLKTIGLIHPIVVTDDLTLVAGARRLEARKVAAEMGMAQSQLSEADRHVSAAKCLSQ